ncbi:MAG: tetratricopeptide repeat protein [Bacteroidales bacterium]
MTEDFEHWEDQEIRELIRRFEGMLGYHEHYFFDTEDYEEIIDFYFEMDNQRKAGDAIDYALKQYPTHVGFMLRKAQLMDISGKLEDALKIVEIAEDIDNSNLDILLTKATYLSRLRQPEKSIDYFKSALLHAENPDEIYAQIAFEYENMGNYHKALENLKNSLDINPASDNVLYELSFCYEVTHQLEKGIRFYEQFLDKNPYSKTAWFCLGVLCNTNGQFEKAIEAYDFVLAIDETFSSAYFNKANSFANLGLYLKAIECYRDTLHYEEPEAMTYFYIGECYEELDDYTAATEQYLEAIGHDESFADAYMAAGNAFDMLEDKTRAESYMKKAMELEPQNPTFLFQYGDLLFEYGKQQQGIEMLEKAAVLDPFDEEIWELLAWMYSQYDKLPEAIKVLNTAMVQLPENAIFPYHLAACLWMNGQVREAYVFLEEALTRNFSKHIYLFDFFPELKQNNDLIAIIEQYRPEEK